LEYFIKSLTTNHFGIIFYILFGYYFFQISKLLRIYQFIIHFIENKYIFFPLYRNMGADFIAIRDSSDDLAGTRHPNKKDVQGA